MKIRPNHQNGKCTTLNHRENVVLHIHNYFRHPKYTPEKSEKNKNISHITYSNMLFKAKA